MAASNYCLVLLLALFSIQDVVAIKGSTISQKGDFPFQADLIIKFPTSNTLFRTGSLVSRNFILTTASNVLGSSSIQIILGVYNVEEKQDPDRRTYIGISYNAHKKYNEHTGANNIALVKLNESSVINDKINIIPIPHRFSSLVGKTMRVSGWGDVTPQTPVEYQVLRYAYITIRSVTKCRNSFPKFRYTQLCSTDPSKYFEEGDIGAPLVLGHTLVAIASLTSYDNGVAISPQLYTRVDLYLKWIKMSSDVNV